MTVSFPLHAGVLHNSVLGRRPQGQRRTTVEVLSRAASNPRLKAREAAFGVLNLGVLDASAMKWFLSARRQAGSAGSADSVD